MKILVATQNTQGARANDFCFAPEEEIVLFGVQHMDEPVDGLCGCRRAMFGINSNKPTTTFKVVETQLIREEFRRLISASFIRFYGNSKNAEDVDLAVECAEMMADFIVNIASEFQVGQILERRGHDFEVREDAWPDLIEVTL